jgi:chromosome transmission fidelity protein 18
MSFRPLDTLTAFHISKAAGQSATVPTRFAVRQVLDQELRKEQMLQRSAASQSRSSALVSDRDMDKENQDPKKVGPKKLDGAKLDFFGRAIKEEKPSSAGKDIKHKKDKVNIFVTFHEGFSNAVRKPLTLKELMEGF